MQLNRKLDFSPSLKSVVFRKAKLAARGSLRFAFATTERMGIASPGGRVAVLCYHSVRDHGLLRISTQSQVFESHLAWLAEHCDVVPFEQIPALARSTAPRPVVAITFDDGYLDNVERALPLLLKYSLPATFFITTGLLRRDTYTLEKTARQLSVKVNEITPIDAPALEELLAAGMSIGTHTHTHPTLVKLAPEKVREEFSSSKRILEDSLNIPITTMAYPYGLPGHSFSRDTCLAAAATGYALAGTTQSRAVRRNEQPFMIPRFVVANETVRDVRCMVLGAFDAFGWYHDVRFRLGWYKFP